MYFNSRLCCIMCWIFPDGLFCNLLLSKSHLSYQYITSECRQQRFWLKLWLHDNVNLILQNLTLDEKHFFFPLVAQSPDLPHSSDSSVFRKYWHVNPWLYGRSALLVPLLSSTILAPSALLSVSSNTVLSWHKLRIVCAGFFDTIWQFQGMSNIETCLNKSKLV